MGIQHEIWMFIDNATRASMCVAIATSLGIVLRFFAQRAIDRTVRRPKEHCNWGRWDKWCSSGRSFTSNGDHCQQREVAVMSGNSEDLQIEVPLSSSSKPSKKGKLGEDVSQNASLCGGKFHNTNIEDIIIVEICAGVCKADQNGTFNGIQGRSSGSLEQEKLPCRHLHL